MNGNDVNTNVFLENYPNDKVKTNFYKQFSRLHAFRSSGYLTDVSLVVGGATYRAHKLVLSCQSQVFEAMFNNDMLESQRGEVVISDVKPRIFSLFLNYVYTGILPDDMTIQDATELLVCADKYQTTSLMFALDKALARRLNADNAVELLQLADSFNRITLKKHARSYIWTNLAKTMSSESWKTIIPNNRQLMNEILEDFHKKARKKLLELQGSLRWCSRNEVRHFRQTWRFDKGIMAFRPKGVKLSFKGKPLKFIVVFARINPDSVVSLYPTSTLPGGIFVHCKVSVRRYRDTSEEFLIETEQQYLLAWTPEEAHPTLGHRRVEIIRWDWWDPERTSMDFELQVYDVSEQLPVSADTVVTGWSIDGDSEQSPVTPTETTEPAEDSVALIFGEEKVLVDRSALLKSTRPHQNGFWKNQDEFTLPDASETTCHTIVRYLNSGLFPPRHKVDLQLLEAAWELKLGDLVMYTEQALIWDLDPTNVVAIAKHCHNRALGWLMWACAQYLKLHLNRVISWDEEWRNFHHEYFEILINEMRDELYPCLLPNFLTALRS